MDPVKLRFYPKSNEKPLKGCKKRQDIIELELLKK